MNFERAEYEIQHFNFSTEQIKVEHRLMMKQHIETLTKNLAESIVKKSNISTLLADNLHSKTQFVVDNIMETIESRLNEFDRLVDKYFSIPENILLPEDIRHEKPYTNADEAYLTEKVTELETEFKQKAYELASLSSEIETYNNLNPVVERENETSETVEESLKYYFEFDEIKSLLKTIEEVQKSKEDRSDRA